MSAVASPVKRPRWTTEEDRRLLWWWQEVRVETIAARLGRSPKAVVEHAVDLELPFGRPGGTDTLASAAKRAGYSPGNMKRILAKEGVPLHRRATSPRTHRNGKGVPYVIDPELVVEAITAKLSREIVSVGAGDRGLPLAFTRAWLVAHGHRYKPGGRGHPWEAPARLLDEAAAWFALAEHLAAAVARTGVPLGRLTIWLRRAGVELYGERPIYVLKTDVDATLAATQGGGSTRRAARRPPSGWRGLRSVEGAYKAWLMSDRAPVTFAIPPGTKAATCRGCSAPVYWIVTALAKRMPVNADGTSHFANCPKADSFRRPR